MLLDDYGPRVKFEINIKTFFKGTMMKSRKLVLVLYMSR
jgi:hypothetical protein